LPSPLAGEGMIRQATIDLGNEEVQELNQN
jgi:hypothetical protein